MKDDLAAPPRGRVDIDIRQSDLHLAVVENNASHPGSVCHDFSFRETETLKREFPELSSSNARAISELLTLNGRRLEIFEMVELKEFFPATSAKGILAALANPSAIERIADAVAAAPERTRDAAWYLFSSLPVSGEVHAAIIEKMLERTAPAPAAPGEVELHSAAAADIGKGDAIAQALPVCNLPHFDTYLGTINQRERLELPPAVIWIEGRNPVELTTRETSEALFRAREALIEIRQDPEAEKKYRAAKGLLDDAPVEPDTVKAYHYNLKMAEIVTRFVRAHLERSGELPGHADAMEIHFKQYRLGLSSEVKETVSKDRNLNRFFASRMAEAGEQSDKIEAPLPVPATIPLSVADSVLREGGFHFEDLPETKTAGRTFSAQERGRSKSEMNELQQAQVAINNATASGEWDTAVRIYLAHLDQWPQYLEHRIGVMDVWQKSLDGQIARFPQTVLSVASGPHEELRAHLFARDAIDEYPMPTIISVDLSASMLAASSAQLPPGSAPFGLDVVADMKDISSLPFATKKFDMVECSSFDNLKSNEEVRKLIADAAGMIKAPGVLRFMVADPFSDGLCRIFSEHGIEILEKNKAPVLKEDARARLRSEKGDDALRRVEGKLKRHCYFLAQVTKEVDPASLLAALKDVEVFEKRVKFTGTHVKQELMRQATEHAAGKEVDNNILLTVARNPVYFLERRKLNPDYMAFALKSLDGQLDPRGAFDIYRAFMDTGSPALAPFRAEAFRIVLASGHADRFISPSRFLMHDDPAVAEQFIRHAAVEPARYLSHVLRSASISEEAKAAFTARLDLDAGAIGTISDFVAGNWQKPEFDGTVSAVLRMLPAGARLGLPVMMRFDERYADTYAARSSDWQGAELSQSEVIKVFSEPGASDQLKTENLSAALVLAAGDADHNLGRQVIDFIITKAGDAAFLERVKANDVECMEVILKIEQFCESHERLRNRAFLRDTLEVPSTPAETLEAARAHIGGAFSELFNGFLKERKRFEVQQEAFDKAMESLFAEARSLGLPPLVAPSIIMAHPLMREAGEPARNKIAVLRAACVAAVQKELPNHLGHLDTLGPSDTVTALMALQTVCADGRIRPVGGAIKISVASVINNGELKQAINEGLGRQKLVHAVLKSAIEESAAVTDNDGRHFWLGSKVPGKEALVKALLRDGGGALLTADEWREVAAELPGAAINNFKDLPDEMKLDLWQKHFASGRLTTGREDLAAFLSAHPELRSDPASVLTIARHDFALAVPYFGALSEIQMWDAIRGRILGPDAVMIAEAFKSAPAMAKSPLVVRNVAQYKLDLAAPYLGALEPEERRRLALGHLSIGGYRGAQYCRDVLAAAPSLTGDAIFIRELSMRNGSRDLSLALPYIDVLPRAELIETLSLASISNTHLPAVKEYLSKHPELLEDSVFVAAVLPRAKTWALEYLVSMKTKGLTEILPDLAPYLSRDVAVKLLETHPELRTDARAVEAIAHRNLTLVFDDLKILDPEIQMDLILDNMAVIKDLSGFLSQRADLTGDPDFIEALAARNFTASRPYLRSLGVEAFGRVLASRAQHLTMATLDELASEFAEFKEPINYQKSMLLLYQLKRGYSDDLLANLNDAGLNSFEVGRIECVYNREDRLAGYAVFIPDYVEGKTTYHRVFVPYRFIRTDQRDYGTPPPPNEVYVTLQRDANKPDVVGILYGVN